MNCHHQRCVDILECTRRNRQRIGKDLWVTALDVEVMAWFVGRFNTLMGTVDCIERIWEARKAGQLDIL